MTFIKEPSSTNTFLLLSIMAKKLELYEREYYFYTNISDYINVSVPKFYKNKSPQLTVKRVLRTINKVKNNLLKTLINVLKFK